MRKIISHLLLLAVVASICNAQAPARPNVPGRPSSPAVNSPARPNLPQTQPNANPQRPVPNRPNTNVVAPDAPNRQQQNPNQRSPNSPTRATAAPNKPQQPNRPLPNNPPQGQQGQVRATPTPRPAPNVVPTSRAPVVNNQAGPQTRSPSATSSTAPVVNGGPPVRGTTTSAAPTTTRRVISNEPEPDHEHHGDLFPTAPTIAPPPEINFPGQTTRGVQLPILPWVPPIAGRPDARCPFNEDSRNPTHLPHDSDCSRFFRCDRGLAFEHQCPAGQHWNARRNMCDFPANANCRLNNMPQMPMPIPQPMPLPNNRPNNNFPDHWNVPNDWSNIMPWTNPPRNQNPGYEHPIIIPMAPRS